MYDDDDRFSDSFEAEFAPDMMPDSPPRRRGCLFLFVSLLLIVALIGSSLAAWFVLGQRSVTGTATETTAEIVRKLADMRPLDAGELSNAAPIEAFAAVLLQLNVRYKTRAAVKFTGIDE